MVTPGAAAEVLAETDPVIARFLAEIGPPRLPRPTETPFAALVRAITSQQIAGPAARAIHGRLVAALDGTVTPEQLLAAPPEALRAAGLSANKAASLIDMFLLFQLRRLDIWPTGDLAVRKGYSVAWKVPLPTTKELDVVGERYHPYRSIVAWYCWQAPRLTPSTVR